jgi:hypothetical protein
MATWRIWEKVELITLIRFDRYGDWWISCESYSW